MRPTDEVRGREALARAVAAVAAGRAEMCGDVRKGAADGRSDKTNPPTAREPVPHVGAGETNPNEADPSARKGARMCGDVRECAALTASAGDETNPTRVTTAATDRDGEVIPRQVAAARLLALGLSGRAVAAEVGVNEHTITRWRRTPAFGAELRRQHALVLAEQVRARRAESADARVPVAGRLLRKYGMPR